MAPHNLTVGQLVMLDGFTPAAYNGEFRVTAVPDNMHFQVTLKTDPGGPATVLGTVAEAYTQNRATLHLHGGTTPWISDGTQHQWITPAGENTNYPKGVSVQNVPDMPDPGPGSHDVLLHQPAERPADVLPRPAYGITRLNVYAGEAAGYLLTDAVEQDLIARGILPDVGIPLIIQDKTFVDPTHASSTTDPDLAVRRSDDGHVAISGIRTSTCRTRTPTTLDGRSTPWAAGTTAPFWPPWPGRTNLPIEVARWFSGLRDSTACPIVLPNLPDHFHDHGGLPWTPHWSTAPPIPTWTCSPRRTASAS